LHQRSIVTLTTSRPKVDFKRIFFAFFVVFFIQIGLFAVSYSIDKSNIEWNFDAAKFIPLLIISLLLFPVQIGFEEYFFRGYLMQQIGIGFKSKWVPLIITSRSEEHTSELQSRENLVCRLLLEIYLRHLTSTLFPYTTLFRS